MFSKQKNLPRLVTILSTYVASVNDSDRLHNEYCLVIYLVSYELVSSHTQDLNLAGIYSGTINDVIEGSPYSVFLGAFFCNIIDGPHCTTCTLGRITKY